MTLRNPTHARRVLALVTESRTERAAGLESDIRLATLQWLRGVAQNDRYAEEDRISACEIRLALESPGQGRFRGYSPTKSAEAWLRKQAARPSKFLASRWARHALQSLGLDQ